MSTSEEQRLSLFLENYLSDATERKSSANHDSDLEEIYAQEENLLCRCKVDLVPV